MLDAFYRNLYGPGSVSSADSAFVSSCRTPCLVLLGGNDEAHPLAISEEVAKLLPDAELIREWKEGAALLSATARMKQFLSATRPCAHSCKWVYRQLDIDTLRGASDHADATLRSGDDEAMATRIVLTYADLVAMPSDGKRYELHEGEIYMTAAPRPRHQQVVGNLYLILTAHVRRLGLGEVFLSPIDVILADVTVVEPDLVYLETARLGRVSDRAIEGPPTLAIEVLSPTTATADRGVKLQLSAKYGVPHYWIVDPDARLVETYRLAGLTYERGPRLDGSTPVALPPFPDLPLDPASVWR